MVKKFSCVSSCCSSKEKNSAFLFQINLHEGVCVYKDRYKACQVNKQNKNQKPIKKGTNNKKKRERKKRPKDRHQYRQCWMSK